METKEEEIKRLKAALNDCIDAIEFAQEKCKPVEDALYCDFFNVLTNAKEQAKDALAKRVEDDWNIGCPPFCPGCEDCMTEDQIHEECSICCQPNGKHDIQCPNNHSPFANLIRDGYD